MNEQDEKSDQTLNTSFQYLSVFACILLFVTPKAVEMLLFG